MSDAAETFMGYRLTPIEEGNGCVVEIGDTGRRTMHFVTPGAVLEEARKLISGGYFGNR